MHLADVIDGLRRLVDDDRDLVRHRMFDAGATAPAVTAVLNALDSERLLPEDEDATIPEVDAQASWMMHRVFGVLDPSAPPISLAPFVAVHAACGACSALVQHHQLQLHHLVPHLQHCKQWCLHWCCPHLQLHHHSH